MNTALAFFKKCRAMTNRFQSVDGEIERLEKQLAGKRMESGK